jgi:hypothetical protein
MQYKIPKYAPTINPGDTRRRIWRCETENPLNGFPHAIMHEEDVTLTITDGESVERSFGDRPPPLIRYPTNLAEVVDLRNVADDALLGQTTIGVIYTMIYSLARHMQKLRDFSELRRLDGAELQESLRIATNALGIAMEISSAAEEEATRLANIALETPEGPERVAAEAAATAALEISILRAEETAQCAAEVTRITTEFQTLIANTGG